MTRNELYELIQRIQAQQSESNILELKSAAGGCPKRLYDTLSAFSNQDAGGIIVFGIEEKSYQVVGVYDVHDLQKKINEQCKQVTPIVRPVFTILELRDKYVLSAEIPSIDISERPCFYAGVGRIKGSYVRVGDSNEPMSEYEIYSYEAYRKKYEDDVRINHTADIKAIDQTMLGAYIQSIKDRNPKLSTLENTDIYKFMNMVIDGKPTLACTLLFSLYPQMFFPQYTINAMVIMGYEKGDMDYEGARFIDNRRIEGTLSDMLEEAIRFVSKNMNVKTIVDKHSGKRTDETEYPVTAIREAIINALVHRDYSIHTQSMPIEIVMYKDRIEISNPGGLYGRLSIDQLGKVQPDTRNPVIARALETLGITENRYSGIPTIRKQLQNSNMKAPVFSNSRREFKVTIYNRSSEHIIHDGQSTTYGSVGLISFCKEPKSRIEIANYLGITTIDWVMKHYINPLIEEGLLKMTKPSVPRSKNQKYYS